MCPMGHLPIRGGRTKGGPSHQGDHITVPQMALLQQCMLWHLTTQAETQPTQHMWLSSRSKVAKYVQLSLHPDILCQDGNESWEAGLTENGWLSISKDDQVKFYHAEDALYEVGWQVLSQWKVIEHLHQVHPASLHSTLLKIQTLTPPLPKVHVKTLQMHK